MGHKFFKIIVVLTVALSMATGGACTALSPQAGKSPCQKNRNLNDGLGKTTAGTCHVHPCRTQKGTLFLLPNSPSGRSKSEQISHLLKIDSSVEAPQTLSLSHYKYSKVLLKLPLSYIPPPLFSFHCSLIC
ncbi:MAG: hypothetical protein DRH90_07520 [Deltaproteobacteria bacterium]|nr:MAG: hypothetical protein DRH90_07520 [Deltaproteobacteria bacterium]